MGIKSTFEPAPRTPGDSSYPRLMQHIRSKSVVLFLGPGIGTEIGQPGFTHGSWSYPSEPESWVPLKGTVTLTFD